MLHNTSIAFFFALLFINILENAESFGKLPPSACDIFTSKPVDYPTLTPINVITTKTKKVHVNSTLIIENGVFIPLTVTNTGYLLQASDYRFEHSSIQTHGGVLCGKTYVFHKVTFFFSSDPKLSSYTQINGEGAPISLSLVYYNKAYGSFEESLKHRDGLVLQNFLVGFTEKDNPLFYGFEPYFKELIKPGSNVTLPAVVVYAAFNKLSAIYGYYAYYGSFTDFQTGKIFPCTIVILAERKVYAISEAQFYRSFGILEDFKGKKLDSRKKIQKTGKRVIARPDGGLRGKFHLF